MTRKRSIRLEIFALCASLIVVLMSAMPLFDRQNDVQILTLFFGAFAAGVACNNLIISVRSKKEGTKTKSEES